MHPNMLAVDELSPNTRRLRLRFRVRYCHAPAADRRRVPGPQLRERVVRQARYVAANQPIARIVERIDLDLRLLAALT
jgi:hypothetical protein